MKKGIVAGLSLVAALSFGAGAHAEEKKADAKQVEKHSLVSVTATVEKIDQATRMVTLKGPKGNLISFTADPEVKNLAQVKVGDQVVVKYYESLIKRVLKPGEAPVNQATAGAAAAKPGEKPAGIAAAEVTVTVSIEGIDKKAGTVTFKTPAGVVDTIKAEDPKNLDLIKVGDKVAITYREAIALSVEPAKKAEPAKPAEPAKK